jgi:hypothetical protein
MALGKGKPSKEAFVFGVAAASRNTRFQGGLLGLTWAGLAPADRASFAGAFFHLITSSARARSVGEAVQTRFARVQFFSP